MAEGKKQIAANTQIKMHENGVKTMKEILKKAIEEQKGFYFENAGMALDHICMALFCRYDIMATYKNRYIYCGNKRVASIEFKKNDYGDLVIHEYHII